MVALLGRARGGAWRLAPSLEAAWREANAIAPGRSRRSDGSIGDAAHAARRSDHNPQESGAVDWVDALDLTHDPRGGFDAHGHARNIAARRDPRVDYVISNGRIWSNARAGEGWRSYSGANPHRAHIHISVRDSGRFDTSPWFRAVVPFPSPPLSEEDDDMTSYIRDQEGGTIYAVYGQRFRALSPTAWENQSNLAKLAGKPVRLTNMHPWAIAKFFIDLRLIEDPTG